MQCKILLFCHMLSLLHCCHTLFLPPLQYDQVFNKNNIRFSMLNKPSICWKDWYIFVSDMDPSAINTFAYYPYAGQQTTTSLGGKSDLVSATAAALAHHQMFTNTNQLQQGAINIPQSAAAAAQYPNTAPSLPQHTMSSYLGTSSGGTGAIISASGPISHPSGGNMYPHGTGAAAAQQQIGMSPAANLGNICTWWLQIYGVTLVSFLKLCIHYRPQGHAPKIERKIRNCINWIEHCAI